MNPRPYRDILESVAGEHMPDLHLYPRITAQLERKPLMQTLRARPVLALVIVLLALLMLSGIVYAVGNLLGYIPGLGIVEQGAPIRVLAEPVSQTRDGITLTVTEAFLTTDKTVVTFFLEGVPFEARSHQEEVSGCAGSPEIRLPDGKRIWTWEGNGSAGMMRYVFSSIPADVNAATFIVRCIQETMPGKAPENWQLSLHFVPASPDLIAPIVEVIPSPAAPVAAPPAAVSLYGVTLNMDKYIPLDDGYYLIGHSAWTDERIIGADAGLWALKAYDSSGQDLPLEPVEDGQAAGFALGPNQWLYKLYGKNFNAPLTLRTTQIRVEFKQPVRMTLDLRPAGFDFSDSQLGVTWKIGSIPLDVLGIPANAFEAKYVKVGSMRGFEIAIQADPVLGNLPLDYESWLSAGAFGSNRDETSGLILSTLLTDAKIFPLALSASGATINGNWETSWNPPAGSANVTPFYIPQACVTLDTWKQQTRIALPIPPGLPEKVLVYRGAPPLDFDPFLFISSLDGSVEQGLASRDGSLSSDGSLSPDGTRLVYLGDPNVGRLYLMDVATGQSTAITDGVSELSPFWSPDGRWIAFNRLTGKGYNIFIVDVHGGNPRPLTDTTEDAMLAGWMPDSRSVIFSTSTGPETNLLQSVDIENGETQTLVATQEYGNGTISPDGAWIAYADSVPGRMTEGIFVARLDGSQKRLLVQLDEWKPSPSIWLPDTLTGNHWLAVWVWDTSRPFTPNAMTALVNMETCQIIPLKGLNGTIQSWVRP